ncbi:MAG TPA: glycosyltransferase [Puia sp.]|nr:glycosyltransferase [Puia sp.]
MSKSAISKPTILIAPLNWGLGHASRCIPIIKSLIANETTVIVACGDSQKHLLQAEFPSLRYIDLPGYDLKYGQNKGLTLLKIIYQIPKILIRIKSENRWLSGLVAKERIDAVISDNRYGLFSSAVYCVFITHQLRIKVPFGKKIENMIQRISYQYINKFSECWVPDFEKSPSLAGDLSHPGKPMETHLRYIGFLSRFERRADKAVENGLLIMLSGPEPQRTILEQILFAQLKSYPGKVNFLRGTPAKKEKPAIGSNISVYHHLPTSELNEIINESEFIICRSGYSSIMDVVKLEKKSIVIPTPGQTEQEYLADYLSGKKIVFSVSQKNFMLSDALEKAKKFSFEKFENIEDSLMEKAVEDLVKRIRK